jgi:hypothetical protein
MSKYLQTVVCYPAMLLASKTIPCSLQKVKAAKLCQTATGRILNIRKPFCVILYTFMNAVNTV